MQISLLAVPIHAIPVKHHLMIKTAFQKTNPGRLRSLHHAKDKAPLTHQEI